MEKQINTSETAVVTASLRALACYEEDINIKGSDQLARIFLPEEKAAPLLDQSFRDMIKKAIPEGLYEYVIARTGYFDEVFVRYLKEEIPQIVILGAGYDSRPYRYEGFINSTVIYESDMAAIQNQKRILLQSNSINVHNNIRYVAVDFEQDDLVNKLCKEGFNPQLKTLFLWEGVTFYLTPTTVTNMLQLIHDNSALHSVLCFDFQSIQKGEGLIKTGLAEEEIRFGIEADTSGSYLSGLGYTVVEHLNADKLGIRYLTRNDGSRLGIIKPMMNIITAEIC